MMSEANSILAPGSPSSWPAMDGGFLIYRSGPPLPCHGDPIIDNLRIARQRMDRSLKSLKECIATARRAEQRYEIGSYLEGLIDELEDGGIDFMYWGWFSRRAEHAMDCVVDAESEDPDDEDYWPVPQEETWRDFRALSAALREHGEALKQLQSAEAMAAPRPANAELTGPQGPVPRMVRPQPLPDMKERPILFSAPMVCAILDGRKSQTRRVVNLPECGIYRLTCDRITYIHSDGRQSQVATNPSKPERRLSSRERREHLQQNEIRWIWEKGLRGLVSISWKQKQKGVSQCISLSREPKGYEVGAPIDLHGLSWHPDDFNDAGSASGRESRKQHAGESGVGNPGGELDGPPSSREWNKRREASRSQADRLRERDREGSGSDGPMQPAPCGESSWNVSVRHFGYLPWVDGWRLWVRETFGSARTCKPSEIPPGSPLVHFATPPGGLVTAKKWPAIFMPRWASRILLEVVAVRVERLQEISEEDAIAEGIRAVSFDRSGGDRGFEWSPAENAEDTAVAAYRCLWESINGPGSWDANPWVWVIEFKRVEP